jgi:RHS repeat-associated protein
MYAIALKPATQQSGTSTASTTLRYILTDHLGSTHLVTDTTGSIVEASDYYAYGAPRTDSKSGSFSGEQRKYIGQYYDASSQLSYLNSRFYDSSRGQFLSEDPVFWEVGQTKDGKATLSNPQAMNAYGYGNGNPISNKDTDGRNPYLIVGSAAYVGSISWDLGTDVYRNFNDPSVPWYLKLSPRGDDAALQYNKDAWSSVAVAETALAGEELVAPAVEAGTITVGGQKVIGAIAGGVANAANAWASGAATNPVTGKLDMSALGANFISGFLGTRVGQAIPNPAGAPPVTLGGSIAGARAITEQIRVQLGQIVQGLTNLLTSIKSSQQTRQLTNSNK